MMKICFFTEDERIRKADAGVPEVVRLNRPNADMGDGISLDAFGVLWKDGEPYGDPYIPEMSALDAYTFPKISEGFLQERLEPFMNGGSRKLRICVYPMSLYDRMRALAGAENLHRHMESAPDFVDALARRVCEHTLSVMEIAFQTDFDVFLLGDTHESELSPELRTRFLRPYLARLFAMTRAYGKLVGKVGRADENLVELGLDAVVEEE